MRRLDERGAAAPLVAICFFALIGAAAVSVDLARVFAASRRLQGMADLAAMSAAQALGGGGGTADAADAAARTVAANPWSSGAVAIRLDAGVYDPTSPPAQRFTVAAAQPNAARVTLSAPVALTFASVLTGRASVQVSRAATAAEAQLAAFSIGSSLASVNGGLANALLSALAGSQVALSAADYQSLISARVDLMGYMAALATRARLTGASYNTLLASQVAAPTALAALGDALAQAGNAAAASAAGRLAASAASAGPLQPGALFDLGPYAAQDHAAPGRGATVSLQALSLADALLEAANGQHELALDLGASVPGLLGVKAWLAVGQRPSHSPWLTVTQSRDVVVSTAQSRLYLQAAVAPGPAAAFGLRTLTLSAYAELASAQARLADLACPVDPAGERVDLSAQPSLGALAAAQADPSTLTAFAAPVALAPAEVASLGPLRFTLSASVALTGGWQAVGFNAGEIAAHAVKSVYADNVAQASLASLIGGAAVQAQGPTGGLGPGVAGPAAQAIQAALQPAGAALDGVLAQLEALTGARLGSADVWIDGVRCRGAALVG